MRQKLIGGLGDKFDPEDFDEEALEKGIEIEMEHSDDPDVAIEIAMDHLAEDPDYYEKLEAIENPTPTVYEGPKAIFDNPEWEHGSEVQTLLFDKDMFSKSQAKKWAKKHDFEYEYVDSGKGYWRVRQADPSEFVKDHFATIEFDDGIKAVIAEPKYTNPSDEVNEFVMEYAETIADALEEEHGYDFDAADDIVDAYFDEVLDGYSEGTCPYIMAEILAEEENG